MKPQHFQAELNAAVTAAHLAQEIIQSYFSGPFAVETKADNTPVTEADVKSEEAIRNCLINAFPEYGFYGEETGSSGLDKATYWLVDPIDGTKSFVRRSPYFSTQIALMHEGNLVLGVSNAPCMGELSVAVQGTGASINGSKVIVSQTASLDQVFLSSGNLKSLARNERRWSGLAQLVQAVARTRGYGDYCHYHQLACGQADVVIESDVNILDIAALTVIVREAGGVITDLEGQAISLETTSVLAACNPRLHCEVLRLLA